MNERNDMELIFLKPVPMEVVAVKCELPVRYDEEDMPNDFPHRKGDMWDITIDIETGQIRDWPKDFKPFDNDTKEPTETFDLYMKVCDEGCYHVLDKDGRYVKSIEENYVPSCIPGEYGDYVNFKIDANGIITNWKDKATQDRFQKCFVRREDEGD
jgi:hypothetical protein